MSQTAAEPDFIPLNFQNVPPAEQLKKSKEFYELLNRRRTIRNFSVEDFPFEIIENAILSAGTAPSGANMQPWRFVVVKDKEIKRQIRQAAECEEFESYQ